MSQTGSLAPVRVTGLHVAATLPAQHSRVCLARESAVPGKMWCRAHIADHQQRLGPSALSAVRLRSVACRTGLQCLVSRHSSTCSFCWASALWPIVRRRRAYYVHSRALSDAAPGFEAARLVVAWGGASCHIGLEAFVAVLVHVGDKNWVSDFGCMTPSLLGILYFKQLEAHAWCAIWLRFQTDNEFLNFSIKGLGSSLPAAQC